MPTAWSTELLEDRSLLSSTSLGSEAASGVTAQEVSSLDGGVSITGPALLKDINTLPASSFPGIHDADRGEDTFAVLNGIAYFFANDGVHGRELWRTDGTAAGTFFAADINPGSDGSSFDGYYDGSYVAHDQLVVAKDMLFLNAFDGIHGGELWTSDGTPAGTYLVKDLYPSQTAWGLQWLTSVGDRVSFMQMVGNSGVEFVTSYGTADSTFVSDLNPGSASSIPWQLSKVGTDVYFWARDAVHGSEPYSSSGYGAYREGDLFPGVGSSGRTEKFTDVSGMAFFIARTDIDQSWLFLSGEKLTTPGPPPGDNLDTTNVNGTFFFNASDATHGGELWKFDGNPANMTLVKDINPGTGSSVPGDITLPQPVNLNGMLFFIANDGTQGLELWKSDGSEGGTQLIKDLTPGAANSTITSLVTLGNSVFFAFDDGVHGRELWKTDGTDAGTQMVKDISPGSAGPGPVGMY